MIIGSLQTEPDTTARRGTARPGQPDAGQLQRHQRPGQPLAGRCSTRAIFTVGVLLGTVVFGVLAGYALARLQFRGRGTVFALVLLVQVVPFQLLMIPLYVLIVRDYGLADTYLGMILPFAINSTAVFIFRQFFLQLPAELFEAARIDGAGELAHPAADRHPAGPAGAAHRGAARPSSVPGTSSCGRSW